MWIASSQPRDLLLPLPLRARTACASSLPFAVRARAGGRAVGAARNPAKKKLLGDYGSDYWKGGLKAHGGSTRPLIGAEVYVGALMRRLLFALQVGSDLCHTRGSGCVVRCCLARQIAAPRLTPTDRPRTNSQPPRPSPRGGARHHRRRAERRRRGRSCRLPRAGPRGRRRRRRRRARRGSARRRRCRRRQLRCPRRRARRRRWWWRRRSRWSRSCFVGRGRRVRATRGSGPCSWCKADDVGTVWSVAERRRGRRVTVL